MFSFSDISAQGDSLLVVMSAICGIQNRLEPHSQCRTVWTSITKLFDRTSRLITFVVDKSSTGRRAAYQRVLATLWAFLFHKAVDGGETMSNVHEMGESILLSSRPAPRYMTFRIFRVRRYFSGVSYFTAGVILRDRKFVSRRRKLRAAIIWIMFCLKVCGKFGNSYKEKRSKKLNDSKLFVYDSIWGLLLAWYNYWYRDATGRGGWYGGPQPLPFLCMILCMPFSWQFFALISPSHRDLRPSKWSKLPHQCLDTAIRPLPLEIYGCAPVILL